MSESIDGLRSASAVRAADDVRITFNGRRQPVLLTALGRHRRHGDRRARQERLARSPQGRCTEQQRRTIIEALALPDGTVQA
ncbi:hypothetical protein [Streptomyces sp. NPDC093707]|uniref:hypothetical protein n=1 Tax=Streptomyces sp. NPDC093707 TaxID=3154984 RepID=UPI0034505B6D